MPGFRLTQDEAWDAIARAHTSMYTTLRRDGRPITLPVWHAVIDRAIFVGTPTATKKLARVGNDPRGYLLVETGKAWIELSAVTAAVTATIVEDAELALRAAAAIDEKYRAFQAPMDRLPAAVRERYAERTMLRLVPDGPLRSWNNRALIGDDSDPFAPA
jgi:hypothetical protein